MNRVVVQEGYSLPFAGYRKRRATKRKGSQQNKMRKCAKSFKGRGSYRAHMKRCLKK